MTKSFTAGERRGMIALLLILAAIITTLHFSNTQAQEDTLPLTDSISANTQHISSDTARETKPTKKNKNKKYKPKKLTPTRDPLSQPVPYETR
jgi:uncharacterized protein (UPF0333 family)